MLEVRDLSCARGGVKLLEGVGFDLAPGRALALRGPNGIGKTTLLRVLVGLQPALKGTVSRRPDAFAYASHADALKATLSVAENLQFWAQVFGAPGGDIAPAIDAFDLEALRNRPAAELSAGQRRRLGLARLVLTGRPIWALDEPTVALDRASVARFGDVVRSHLDAGGSAIIATHIDLGVEAETVDLTSCRAALPEASMGDFDEAFL